MSSNTPWYTQTIQEVLEEINRRKQTYGLNELPKEKPLAWWRIFFHQLISPLILILIAAAGISAFLKDWVDAGVILAAIILNTLIGFVQELKASRALVHLQALIQPMALVKRNGRETEILARELIPGDILLLQTGDQVTADARLIETFDLQVNEAPLTGESLPIEKQQEPIKKETSLAERSNMVFAGTSVVAGRAVAVVVATGIDTEIGAIAKLIAKTDDTQTPLQKQLAQLARWIAMIVVGIVVLLFLGGLLSGRAFVEMFEISVALAVAAIPEGLVVSVTIILAIGMQRILKRRSLVRRLVAAETLGSVSVICSDKTGTITEGNMRVVSVMPTKEVHTKEIYEALVLCNEAKQADGENGTVLKGTPTERALFAFALEKGMNPEALSQQYPRIGEIPFDSSRKYRLTHHGDGSASKMILIGASSKVFAACEMTPDERTHLEQMEHERAREGFRLVVVATKSIQIKLTPLRADDLNGFTCLGVIALQDPLRPDIPAHIAAVARAGIRTILVTGDHPETSKTIAKQAGLSVSDEQVITGPQLDAWSDEELNRRISDITVFARVEPRHKIRIVSAWQRRGEVVAMTGDGVNDAPALKAADIGIVVGTATEVAKQASDLVLLDNNFSTIAAAVEEGRVIFDNIRKSSAYLMADSFTEIILIAGSLLLGLPVPILSAQILWVNLVADSLPNVGLTMEPGEKDVMSLPPRPRREPVLNKEMMTIIFTIGLVTDVMLFGLYFWLLQGSADLTVIRSIMFAAVGIDSLIYVFAVKSFRRSIFRINPFSNLWLLGGVAIGFALMLLALLHPFFQSIFEIVPLSLFDWLLLLMIGMLKLVAIELVKEWFIFRRRRFGLYPPL